MAETKITEDRLVHIADLHFWRIVLNPLRMMNKRFFGNLGVAFNRRHDFIMDRAEPFADAVAATGVSTVVLTGDFASTSLDEEFALATRFVNGLRQRGLDVHLVPGNHDVYTVESCRARRFEKYFHEFIPENGYPARVTLPGGTPLILVPTVCQRPFSARGRVTIETVEAVSELLEGCGPVAIVAAHYPVLHSTDGYDSNRFRRLENAELLREALGKTGKRILYAAGHVHRSSFVSDPLFPNIQHLTTSPFFGSNPASGADGEFTEITVTGEAFSLVQHRYAGRWTATPLAPGGRGSRAIYNGVGTRFGRRGLNPDAPD